MSENNGSTTNAGHYHAVGLMDHVVWPAGGRRHGRLCTGTIIGRIPPNASLHNYCVRANRSSPERAADEQPYLRFLVQDDDTGQNVCVHPRWLTRVTGNADDIKAAARDNASFVKGMQPLPIGNNGGCGTATLVVGTNGGTMPCGAMLACFGVTKPYYCPACEARINAADPGVEYAYAVSVVDPRYNPTGYDTYTTAAEARASQDRSAVAWLKSDENVGIRSDGMIVTIVRVAVKNKGKDKNNAKTEG